MRWLTTTLVLAALGGAALAQSNPAAPATAVAMSPMTAPVAEVDSALGEIQDYLEGQLACGSPEVWEVKGSLEAAAEALSHELDMRGWTVMQHGMVGQHYALLIDPNPEDPGAYVLGGMIENGSPASHYTFLAECRLNAFGPPDGQTARR